MFTERNKKEKNVDENAPYDFFLTPDKQKRNQKMKRKTRKETTIRKKRREREGEIVFC